MSRKKILLMAHDVTLAHVGRPLKLGELLHADGHDVVLATSADSARFLAGFPGRTRTLAPTGKARFIDNLAKGRPVFDYATLKRYAEEDEAVLSAEKPDLVIGDFRITLSITARRLSIPYATLTNAYWSPAFTPRFIVPDLPMVRFLGVRLSQAIFDAVRPLAFALHCRPMDALRRHYGLPPLGPDLRRIYTDADLALFSDIPEVYGLYGDIPGGHFLGPVRWSPEVPLPDWWAALDPNKPLIYVTLGSSGDGRLLPRLLDRLARPGLQLAVATAGATVGVTAPDVFCADYLPGDAVAARAALVICNGGSPTCAQALAAGVPVLGVPGNLDQYLNMHYLEGQSVGLTLRNRELDGPNLKRTVDRLLGEPSFRRAAQFLAATLSRYDLAERLREALRRLTA